jgi:SAM-dependent methyltransferase
MMSNKEHYLNDGIGDRYFSRRKSALDDMKQEYQSDPVYIAVKALGLKGSYLEIGCGNGWRLDVLGLDGYGIDPSREAIKGNERLHFGTADNLPFVDNSFDIVCFGFCLYAVDNHDLFKVAYEADRVSREYVIVYDFIVDGVVYKPNPDCPAITTCKMDYSNMFEWHPKYRKIYSRRHSQVSGTGDVEVSVFKKT